MVIGLILVLASVLVQTSLFSRFRLVTPDLVMLSAILFALTGMRREGVLAMAFLGGLTIDLLGSTVLGLRASVFVIVAYLGIRTRERVDVGPIAVAIWVGLLTLVGVVLFLLVGTLFGQGGLISADVGRRVVAVPIANLVFSFLLAPLFTRVMADGQRGLL